MNICAVLAGLVIGQAITAPTDSARMNAIWGAFDDRINIQTDIWFESGEFPRCVQALRCMVSIHPEDYELMTNLGWMMENTERWKDALAVYIGYRKQFPDDPESYFPEAQFYYMKKAYSKVPPLLEPSLKMRTKPHPNTYRTLAQSYERMGLLTDAKRVYQALLELLPEDGATTMNLARVERKLKGGEPAKPEKR